MVSTTTNEYFESADLYFEPDDPAVWNPEDFSPHQRFRSFLSKSNKTSKRWQQHHHHSQHHSLKTGNLHQSASPATHRYFFTTSSSNSSRNKQQHPETTTHHHHHFSESLASLARTSTSSSGDNDQEGKVNEEEHEADDASCCHSLTYSVESERFLMLPFEEDDHQYLTGQQQQEEQPQSDGAAVPRFRGRRLLKDNDYDDYDVYFDDTATNTTSRNSILWVPVSPTVTFEPGDDNNNERRTGCFQLNSTKKMECFHPLAWIGNAFQLLIRNVEDRKLEETR